MISIAQQVGHSAVRIETAGKATEFLRFGLAKALAPAGTSPADYAADRWPHAKGLVELATKAPVAVGTTTGWGSPVAELTPHAAALIETLRPATVLGRMTGFRRVPFAIRVPRVTAGASMRWVGQGHAKAVTKLTLGENVQFPFAKIAGLVVFSRELAENSDPAVEALIRADITASIAQFTDEQFLNPSIAEVDGVSPASITNGAPEIVSTGAAAANVEADFASLFAAVTTNLSAPYLIMKRSTAVGLAQLRSTNGDHSFPDVGALGGSIWGIPVLTSASAPADTNSPADNIVVLLDAAEVLLAEGAIEFSRLEHITVELSDSPDSPPVSSTVTTSLWQANLIGLGVDRYLYWARRREGCVAYISGVPF